MIDPGQDKDFTISMINPNYLPYVMSVSIIKNETIDTTKEISSDLILIGPDVIISSSGNLTLKCKRIIQSPSIHIENGGTLKIEQYEDH